jgi:SAM-dependent methyltransferase
VRHSDPPNRTTNAIPAPAAAYDDLNADDDDYRFYAALADEVGATSVLDLGCGTGTLTRLLAAHGRPAIGIDPDPEMLRVAHAKPSAVDWRLGRSDSAPTAGADFAVMSGHVAQVFREDASWAKALHDLHRALVAGGTLAFESRNPAFRGWERWTRPSTLRTVDTPDGPVEFWHETAWVSLPLVAYDTISRNLHTGEEESGRDVLAFRDEAALVSSLEAAGFAVSRRYGDWQTRPLTPESPELILVAQQLPSSSSAARPPP